MPFLPTIAERLARARSDLRMGLPIVLSSNGKELMVFAAETITQHRLDEAESLGDLAIVVTARRAETLKIPAYDGDIARLRLPDRANLDWVQNIADPTNDLTSPMKGPFQCDRNGPVDMHRRAIELIKQARLLPAALVLSPVDQSKLEYPAELSIIDLGQISEFELETPDHFPAISANLPLSVSEHGRLHVFRPRDGDQEHYAIEIGKPDRSKSVLTRLHSACFTGDLLGSLKCDCGPQLRAALAKMGDEGSGVLLYLNQEGRGIGLANKMRAYALQDQGFDTVEANHRLGFEDDERDFKIGSDILRQLGFTRIQLLTNNPAKVAMMQQSGIEVTERIPLQVGKNAINSAYLATKAAKSGHLL